MDGIAPIELHQLLQSQDLANREAAWDRLIDRHTRLLIAVARSFGGDHDEYMERYSYVLEKLREGDFRRLRAYNPSRGARFSTWLTVTARHLCLDLHRSRFGRLRNEEHFDEFTAARALRRALNDLTEGESSIDSLPDLSAESVDHAVARANLDACLRDVVTALTPRQRLLLTLRFEDDLPAVRIARVLGLPTQFHVYRQLNALLAQMRGMLKSRGIDGSDG